MCIRARRGARRLHTRLVAPATVLLAALLLASCAAEGSRAQPLTTPRHRLRRPPAGDHFPERRVFNSKADYEPVEWTPENGGVVDEPRPDFDAAPEETLGDATPAHHHEGAVLGDAPTPEEFAFTPELTTLCEKQKYAEMMWMLPLSMEPDTDPRDSLLTSTSQTPWVNTDVWMSPHWKSIRPYLTARGAIFPSEEQFESCAVVGNSGNLLKTTYGSDIDRHDVVFRFNMAPAGGSYQNFVGSKTHFRAMNAKQSKNMALGGYSKAHGRLHIPWERNVTLMLYRFRPDKLARHLGVLRKTLSADKANRPRKVAVMDRRFLNHTTHLLHQFHHCRKQRLGERAGELGDRTATAGLAVVMNALRLCKHVSAYGLGEKINAFTKKHFHYYKDTVQSFIDERDIVRLNVTYNGFGRFNDDAHDFTLESDMLTGLAKAGALRHCTMYGCRGLEYPWQEESAEDKAPQELVMYDGAVIADAPSPKNFTWEKATDVASMCRAGNISEAVKKLPLSYALGTDPKDLLISTDTDLRVLRSDHTLAPNWPMISPYVTHSKNDFFGANLTRFDSCAIVGGSGGLLKANYGPEIDRHTAVFRFNLAPAGGEYAEFAGSKTNFRLLNNVDSRTQSLNGRSKLKPPGMRIQPVQWDANSTFILSRIRSSELHMRMKMFRRTMQSHPIKKTIKVGIMDKRFFKHVANFMDSFRVCKEYETGQDSADNGDKSPSSGLVMVLNAMHLCKHVTMYGIADKPSTFIRHHFHYFKDNSTKLPDYVLEELPEDDEIGRRYRGFGHANTHAHSFDLERSIFAALSEAGLLRHCTWEGCTGKELEGLEDPPPSEATDAVDGAQEATDPDEESFPHPLSPDAAKEWAILQAGQWGEI